MKEEALKLADELDNFLKEEEQLPWGTKQVYLDMASTMIRRLVEELDKQKEKTKWFEQGGKMLQEVVEKHESIPSRKEAIDKARAKQTDRYKMAWNMAENELEKTKQELDCALDYIKQYQLEKQGEPVAWLKNGNVNWVQYPMDMSKPVPLYTTPQTQSLSDDEIISRYRQIASRNGV